VSRGRGGAGLDPRAALIDEMARSCLEHGYLETTIEGLLAGAGLTRADFDRHFASKEECALAAVETILSEGMATVSTAYSADRSERESALRSLRSLLELFASDPARASLAFTESRQMMPAAASERYRSGFAILTAMLDRLRADARKSAAPPQAARAAIGGGEALVRREIAAGRGSELPRILPDLVYSATVPFLGQAEALRLARQARKLLAQPS
jgi:AcrR family transcriptional regulator